MVLTARECGECRRQSRRLLKRSGAGRFTFAVPLLAAALFSAGCGEQAPSERVTANDVKQQTAEALAGAAQLAQQEKNDFQRAVQEELDEMKVELDALRRETDAAQGKARQELQQQVQLLEEKWSVAEAKLAALRTQSAQAWAAMEEQVLVALADLKESYQELRRQMMQG
jgi:hypothetical protein